MDCKNCSKPVIYRNKRDKRVHELCKFCMRSELGKKFWAIKKENGHIHHWLIKPARLGDTQSMEAREKMREAHLKPENIKIAMDNLKKINNWGENSPHWINDRTKLKDDHRIRGGQLHREWSVSVKKRDSWICRINNQDCNGRLESHHILGWKHYPELRYDINNGITLCHFHHPRKREDEINLSPYFQKLVAELN